VVDDADSLRIGDGGVAGGAGMSPLPPGDPMAPAATRRPTSVVLSELAEGLEGPTVTLAELSRRLGDRAFGMVILLPALVNLIPNIPGLTILFGLLMLVPSLQMAVGLRQLWLPARIGRIRLGVPRVQRLIVLGLPHVRRLERYLRPRWTYLTYPPFESLIGLALIFLSLLVAVPIPFSNLVPGFAIVLIALGIVERDGIFIVAGITVGAAAAVFVGVLVAAALRAAGFVIGL
jgi:hypothetical protein